jgi:hypothetical protein
LLDITGPSNQFSDLADIKRIVVTLGFGLRVDNIWVFPSLDDYIRALFENGREGYGQT